MKEPRRGPSLIVSLIIVVAWLAIGQLSDALQFGQKKISLDYLVTQQIVVSLALAPLILLGIVAWQNWWHAVGLRKPETTGSWWLLWLPGLLVTLLLGSGAALGLPPIRTGLFVLLNTIMVGVAEELLFRGILLAGLLSRFRLWPSIWLTSALFGSVHAANGFLTGDFSAALTQALVAAMSGIWLMGIRLRTRSLYPGIAIHFLWDFSTFIFSAALAGNEARHGAALSAAEVLPTAMKVIVSILVGMPTFLYGLWLLRPVNKQDKEDFMT